MWNSPTKLTLAVMFLVATAGGRPALAQPSGDYELNWYTIDGGGDMWTGGGGFEETDSSGYAPIEPGDLLTTSDIPGYAARVTDHQRAQGAVLGKAMERLEKGEKGRILVLVTLQ